MRRWMVSCILCAAVQPAYGSQSFTNLSDFLGALGGTYTTYGFDNLAHGTVLSTQLPKVDFQSSGTVVDVNIGGGSAHTPPNVLATTASPINFLFGPSARAVGFHNTSTVDEVVTYVSENFGGTLFQGLVPPGGFLGFISDTPIGFGTIGWLGPQNTTFSIDTFIFRAKTDVPVPSTTGPFVLGLAALLAAAGLYGIHRRSARLGTGSQRP